MNDAEDSNLLGYCFFDCLTLKMTASQACQLSEIIHLTLERHVSEKV
jgi:hypothetical protein